MSPGWTAGAEAVLSRELVAARVGWRLALVGDEVTVLQARAFAVEAGALAHLQAEGSLHTLRAHEGTLQLSGGGRSVTAGDPLLEVRCLGAQGGVVAVTGVDAGFRG